MHAIIRGFAALLFVGFFCGTAVSGQEATDMKLEDAGFVARLAETPASIAQLRTLPARKFIRRVKAGRPYYIYVDPDLCKCAYLGDQDAMNDYRDMVGQRRQQFRMKSPDAPLPSHLESEHTRFQDIDAAADNAVLDGGMLDFKF